jgi:hypothetical protein
MRDVSLVNIVNAADPADDEDVLLRAALVVALCDLYADKEGFVTASDEQDAMIESQDGGAGNGTSTVIPLRGVRPPAPARILAGRSPPRSRQRSCSEAAPYGAARDPPSAPT